MSCFFCSSDYHVSHYCDIYDTDELRHSIVATKHCCPNCLTSFTTPFVWCENCQDSQNYCFLCFSTNVHPTIYCPNRFKAQMILPDIDNDLFCRFAKLLHFDEKYLVAFLNPKFLLFAKLNSLTIQYQKHMRFPMDELSETVDLVVADSIYITKNGQSIYGIGISPSTYFNVRHLGINIAKFSSIELLILLSTNTKIFTCGYTEFHPILMFQDIIKKAPNLEEMNLSRTNAEINQSWPADLVHFNTSNAIKYLYLRIKDFDFPVESLVDLFKKDSAKDLQLFLYIDTLRKYNLCGKLSFENIQLPKYFSLGMPSSGQRLRISLCSFIFDCLGVTEFKDYVLKDDI